MDSSGNALIQDPHTHEVAKAMFKHTTRSTYVFTHTYLDTPLATTEFEYN